MWRRGRNRRARRMKTKCQRRQEKQSLHGRQPAPSSCPNEPDQTLPSRVNDINNDDNTFADTSRTPQDKVESKGEKETLWHLLLQRNTVQQPLLSWLLWYLLFQFLAPQLPQGSPSGHNPSHQGVVTANYQEEGNWGRVQDL